MDSEDKLFFVDTEATEEDNTSENKELNDLISHIKSSLFTIDPNDAANDLYFDLLPKNTSIKETLEKCPVQVEYFKPKSKEESKQSKKFKDPLINSLDDYLEELKPKNYKFITDGIETKKDISTLGMSENQLKKLNRKEREKTKGAKWFNMKAPEMTEELKNDLSILQMRSALDPKHFYKRSEMKTLPKYFEIGQVVESPVEYHNSKDIRKRKRTLVDELMADAEFQKFNKKKYQEYAAEKQKKSYFKKPKKAKPTNK
ncbi:deoxynucleotidyltransferase terminal-interacting protein 2 [Chironomus tepperi]|uniref:deoxynucleotidyltransferase terminal-interacting protein 2 n=1 Tax=Chironomus tepperi TaxID=113505 RepID=UPI00391F9665